MIALLLIVKKMELTYVVETGCMLTKIHSLPGHKLNKISSLLGGLHV